MEDEGRRGELALYVLPKGLNSLYQVLLQRGKMVVIPYFEVLLGSIGSGLLMSIYQGESEALTPWLKRLVENIVGVQ